MLYARYREKALKRARIFAAIKKFRWLIILISVFIVALCATLMSVSGLVYEMADCPQTVVYGEELGYKAGAVFNKVSYQYAAVGSDDWSENVRLGAGEYKVRAVSKSISGAPRYGAERSFTVLPKNIDVYADDGGFRYGDEPSFTGDTCYGDKLICSYYNCEYSAVNSALVTPLEGYITAVDENGAEVGSSYIFNPVGKSVPVLKREITVIVGDKSVEYDGNAHSSDIYALDSATTLAAGDSMEAAFTFSATEAGTYRNIPQITLYHDTTNVTDYYDIDIKAGNLTVLKREIHISSDSAQKTYDGDPLSCSRYTLDAGYAAVKGHTFAVKEARSVVNAGSYDNVITLFVYDADGKDVSNNYNIICGGGTLEVLQRPVEVRPVYSEKIYDGTDVATVKAETTQSSQYSLLSGHSVGATVVLHSADVGESTAQITAVNAVDENGISVTGNYKFTYATGTVKTLPRPVTLTPLFTDKTYDGTVDATVSATAAPSSEYALVSGHTAEASAVTSQTDVGTCSVGIVSARIYNGTSDVTKNYVLTFTGGFIRIVPRPVTVTAHDGEWIYDGNEHSEEGNTADGLVLNHSIVVLTSSAITEVGKIDNELTVDIVDGERSVKRNYTITYKSGALTVKKRPVTVVAASREIVYNGYVLAYNSYSVSSETPLVTGQYATAWVVGSRTDVGESPNVIEEGSVHIYGYGNLEYTHNYEISYEDGVLKITPRRVTIAAVDAFKQYDGKPLTSNKVEIENVYGILKTHEVTSQTVGSQTEIGRSKNSVVDGTVVIKDGLRDITFNYEIIGYNSGWLTVQYPWTFAYSTGTDEKIYDGTPLSCGEYEITKDVPEGFTAQIKVVGTLKDTYYYDYDLSEYELRSCGQTPNTAEVKVYDSEGKDVTHLVYIVEDCGTLTVLPRPVIIETNSHTWEYDGMEHSDGGFIISALSEYDLLEGHTAKSDNIAEIVNVGAVFNSMDIIIRNQSNTSVTKNYDISFDYGTLEITGNYNGGNNPDNPDNPGGVGGVGGAGGGSLDKDGGIGLGPNGSGGDGDADENTVLKIYSDTSGEVYLRLMSFGDYNGSSWSKFADYTGRVGNYGMSYITGSALDYYGYKKSHMTLDVLSDDYVLPYYISPYSDESAYRVQKGDVYFQGDTGAKYSVDYYVYDYSSDVRVFAYGEPFYSAERKYRDFVHSKYLTVPSETRAYMQSLINANGWLITDYGIVATIAKYIQNAANYNMDYDRRLDSEKDIAVSFLRDYKQGICQHYASAATLLFRTLGIPARYTIGYAGSAVAGRWMDVTGGQAHAWVEVYIDGAGWIQVEVTGGGPGGGSSSGSSGGQTVLPKELTIRPVDAAKPYDGTPLVPSQIELTYDLKVLLFAGYTYSCDFIGGRTDVGESNGFAANFTLYDERGKEVTSVIYKYLTCTLTVTPANQPVVTIHPYSITLTYDGWEKYYGSDDYYVTGLPTGYYVRADLSLVSLTDAGMVSKDDFGKVAVSVYDENGMDVTQKCYVLWDTSDMLTVFKRKITITAASAEKVYDGKPLSDDDYFISGDGVSYGHRIEVVISGSATEIGSVKNEITGVKIYSIFGKDVTDNYDISFKSGVLSVISG